MIVGDSLLKIATSASSPCVALITISAGWRIGTGAGNSI